MASLNSESTLSRMKAGSTLSTATSRDNVPCVSNFRCSARRIFRLISFARARGGVAPRASHERTKQQIETTVEQPAERPNGLMEATLTEKAHGLPPGVTSSPAIRMAGDGLSQSTKLFH